MQVGAAGTPASNQKKKWGLVQDIRWFMVFYYITCCAVWGALSHNNAIVRTLEKRFGLSAFQSGFILSVNDIVNMVLVLFVGYLGRTWSKPHFLGIMCIMGAVGSGLFALPYPLYPATPLDNSTNTPLLCLRVDREEDTCQQETEAASNSNSAYALLLIASAILGIGNSGLGVLSLSYIDENCPKNVAALYIGIASSANTIGPLFGFGLAFLTLSLPENLKESEYDQDDERFIGCWWLSFVIWAGVMLVGSLGMLLCPKHLPYYYEQKKKAQLELMKSGQLDKDKNRKKTLNEILNETASNLVSVFTNVPYMLLVLSTLCAYYIVPGIFAQIPKYLVVQFKIDQAMTAIYTGLSGALVLSIALVILGWFIKTVNLQLRGAILMFGIAILGTVGSLVGMMFWDCEQQQIAGYVDVVRYDIPYYPQCIDDANCTCTGVQPMCSPVDDLTFVSPCHAGCNRFNRTADGAIFYNCACVHGVRGDNNTLGGGWVEGGLCPMPVCNTFIPFLFFVALMSCCSAAARLAAIILQLRFIRKDMKSFAIGLSSFIHNGLAFVPGPIVFGAIFDTTCVLWQELECGDTGACIKYNMHDYRWYMHGISLGFQVLSLAFIPCMYSVSKPMFNIQPDRRLFDREDTGMNGNAFQENGKQPIANGTYTDNRTTGIINHGADLSDGYTFGVMNLKEEQTPM